MKVIGITGTLGAGKGTIVEYLITEKGFEHFSVRAYLVEEIERRGMKVDRDSMVVVANELRAQNSPSFITDELHKKAVERNVNAVIESIRTPGEVVSLKQKGDFLLFAVDADAKSRYERVVARKSETDKVSWETFQENERREMSSEDPNKQNLMKCIEMADVVFNNDGSMEALYQDVEKAMKENKITIS